MDDDLDRAKLQCADRIVGAYGGESEARPGDDGVRRRILTRDPSTHRTDQRLRIILTGAVPPADPAHESTGRADSAAVAANRSRTRLASGFRVVSHVASQRPLAERP